MRPASANRLGASAGMNHSRRRLKMESKQTTKKSKANVILAKTRMSAKLQGEGDYEAARRYGRNVRKFVQRADIEGAARAAARARSSQPARSPTITRGTCSRQSRS